MSRPRYSIQFRILRVILSGGILALTAFLFYWAYIEYQARIQAQSDQIITSTLRLRFEFQAILDKQLTTMQVISNSLELRRHIIRISQDQLKQSIDQVQSELRSIDETWIASKNTQEDVDKITGSLEAKYLSDAILASGSYISHIIVTDAFGAVRIATQAPERFLFFEENWWQQSLFLSPSEFFSGSITNQGNDILWDISIPLRNDDGVDAVGVVKASIYLNKIFNTAVQISGSRASSPYLFINGNSIYPLSPTKLPITSSSIQKIRSQRVGLIKDIHYLISYSFLFENRPNLLQRAQLAIVSFSEPRSMLSVLEPPIRDAILLWFAGVLVLVLVSSILSRWITIPLSLLTHGVREIADGRMTIRIPSVSTGEIGVLTHSFNRMAERLHQSQENVEKMMRSQREALTTITSFIQEIAESSNILFICKTLTESCCQNVHADSGILFLHDANLDFSAPAAGFGIDDVSKSAIEHLHHHKANSRTLYYSWSHSDFLDVWDNNFQILLSLPVRSQNKMMGNLHLLFRDAPDTDLMTTSTIDLLVLLAGISITRILLNKESILQKNRLEGILSGISGLICILDRRMRIIWHSPSAYDFLDLGKDQSLMGQQCCTLFKGREKICPDCPAELTFTQGTHHRVLQRWIRQDGSLRWVEAATFPLKSEDNALLNVILMVSDVTQKIEEEIVIHRFSHAIENIAEGVAILDLDGILLYTNAAFKQLLKITGKDPIGDSIYKFFPPDNPDECATILTETRKSDVWKGVVEMITAQRDRLPISISMSMINDISNISSGIVLTCVDLSQHQTKEKELMRRFRSLHILNQISQIISQTSPIKTIITDVISRVIEFTGATAGAVVLNAPDTNEPFIAADLNLPQYLIKYFDEIRKGRNSDAYIKIIKSGIPLIYENLKSHKHPEAKLLSRLGINSCVFIKLATSNSVFGFISLFAVQAYQFSKEDIALFESIASQLSLSVQNANLHEQMVKDAGLTAVGIVLDQISGDIKQVLQSLESSGNLIQTGVHQVDFQIIDRGWALMSRSIRQLLLMTTNILDYNKEFHEFYFAEDPNDIIASAVEYFRARQLSPGISFLFEPVLDFTEVFVNKIALGRALINLLGLAIDACDNEPGAGIVVSLAKLDDIYRIQIRFSGMVYHFKQHKSGLVSNGIGAQGINLSLTIVQKAISANRGMLEIQPNPEKTGNTFVLILPMYPIRSKIQ